MQTEPIKGQIKPKADYCAVDSPHKTNELICFVCKLVRSFFGRICSAPKLLLVLSDLYEQLLDFPFCFCLPCVCLGDLGASVRFSTVSSTKRSSNLSVHKVSILSWSLFFEKGCINRLGSYLPISVRIWQNPYALWLPNFP